jgi:hypothetical protein
MSMLLAYPKPQCPKYCYHNSVFHIKQRLRTPEMSNTEFSNSNFNIRYNNRPHSLLPFPNPLPNNLISPPPQSMPRHPPHLPTPLALPPLFPQPQPTNLLVPIIPLPLLIQFLTRLITRPRQVGAAVLAAEKQM